MAAIASVVIELLAKTGSFVTDIDRATKKAEKSMRDFRKGVEASFTGNLLAGFADTVISKLASMPGAILHGIDALNDFADATGTTVENASALEDVAARTGSSFDAVTSGVIKFNSALQGAEGEEEKNKVARALKAINLNAEDLKKLDPAEALLKVAKTLSGYADDQNKAAIVQSIFSKSIREMGPYLKDLGDQEKLVGTVTAAQAQEVEKFNQGLSRLGKTTLDVARYLSQDFITSVNNAVDAWRDSGLSEAVFTFFTGTDAYKLQKQLVDLTEQLLVDQAELDRLNSSRANAQQIETQKAIVAGLNQRIDKTRQLLALTEPDYFKGKKTEPAKPSAPKVPEAPKKKEGDTDFEKYMKKLDAEEGHLKELNALESLNVEIAKKRLDLKPGEADLLRVRAAQVDQAKIEKQVVEETIKASQARRDAERASIEEGIKLRDDMIRSDKDRVQNMLDATSVRETERLLMDLRLLDEAYAKGGISEQVFTEAQQRRVGLTEENTKNAISLTKELGDTFETALNDLLISGQGIDDVFKSMIKNVANLIVRLGVIEPLMKRIRDAMGKDAPGGGFNIGEFLMRGIGAALGGGASAPVNLGTASGPDLDLFYGGAGASGLNVFPGGAYTVGESGKRELFVPTTAGRVMPIDENRGGGLEGLNISVLNQTEGRVDRAVPQKLSDRDLVLILQQNRQAIAADFADANSQVSRALRGTHNVQRRR